MSHGSKLELRNVIGLAITRREPEYGRRHSPIEVKAIRQASGMTQQAFASTYGFTLGALRDWEQGRKCPERAARVLLRVIAEAPEAVARAAAMA
jgi:DNA-binding transcriptional regulator YiaG